VGAEKRPFAVPSLAVVTVRVRTTLPLLPMTETTTRERFAKRFNSNSTGFPARAMAGLTATMGRFAAYSPLPFPMPAPVRSTVVLVAVAGVTTGLAVVGGTGPPAFASEVSGILRDADVSMVSTGALDEVVCGAASRGDPLSSLMT
jgi:hypothetical protein